MAETRQEIVPIATTFELYRASVYEKINIKLNLNVAAFVGFQSTIPPLGSTGAFRLPPAIEVEFFVGPGDSVWIGSGPAIAPVDMVASPLPWPVDLLETLGIRPSPPAEAFDYVGVPAVGDPVRAYQANEYVEVAIGVRVTTPGNGLMAFNSAMNNPLVVPSAVRPIRIIMAPGDQMFLQAGAALRDFNIIVSPAPWWDKNLWKMAERIDWARISQLS